MKGQLTPLALVKNDSRLWRPKEMLKHASVYLEELDPKPNKAVVLFLYEEDKVYETSYIIANMSLTESMSLCDNIKMDMRDDFKTMRDDDEDGN